MARTGACALAAPCRTFACALTQTAAGGEIDVLDPAGYGTVTITKAISIVNDGVGVAAIGASSGNAITINAGASDVHLRGLTIEGLGTGTNGILFHTGGNLAIENCAVAARRNSSLAPHGPRSRKRPTRRMRLRWANSISTFFRRRQAASYSGVEARARATSRASSCRLRGILRATAFGQQRALSSQTSQSSLLAR
jgi:hypothetical protein